MAMQGEMNVALENLLADADSSEERQMLLRVWIMVGLQVLKEEGGNSKARVFVRSLGETIGQD